MSRRDEIPPERQCTHPSCAREAVDTDREGELCAHHLEKLGEPVSQSDESGGENLPDGLDNETETHDCDGVDSDGDGVDAVTSLDKTRNRGEYSTDSGPWASADFSTPTPGVWPEELLSREQWMGHVEKRPFAPWGDRNHPDAEPDVDARWKWGLTENYVDGETVAMAEADPRLDGRVFLQQEDDSHAFVDGDDVRCPDTGDVHPEFVAILDALGFTYTDVSTSGTGVHAYYHGEIPIDDVGQVVFDLDTEPWGANDDVPSVEIYANKHVCVATGEHVTGTPTTITAWDDDALAELIEEYVPERDRTPSTPAHDTDRDPLEDYEPTATGTEQTDEIRDVYHAIDRLDADDLPLRTSQVDIETNGWEKWDPSSYRTSSGGDSLHTPDRRVFYDQKNDRAFGVLSLYAAEQGILSRPWERLEGADWWEAIERARDAGAPLPEFTGDDRGDGAEPVAPLALAKLEALNEHERERYARKHGLEAPSTDEARTRLRDAIFRELRAGNTTVLDAPTALGKSYTVATTPWLNHVDITGDAPVIHAHATKDARDEAVKATRQSAAGGEVLKGRKEISPLARGDHDPVEDPDAENAPDVVVTIDGQPASEWFDEMCEERDIPFSTALALARIRNDQGLDELPPFGQKDPAVAQWEGLPWNDHGWPAADIIHVTHQFTHVPSLRKRTNVILDEQPDYTVEIGQDRIRRMVTAYLREIDAPVRTWEALVTTARDETDDVDVDREALDDLLGEKPDREWYVDDPNAHALAPDLTKAVWKALTEADDDANGRRSWKVLHEPPRLDAGDEKGYAGTWLSIVINDENTIQTVRKTPDFSQARSVIGLDAHPCMPLWELNGAPGMVRDAVLDADERHLWRRLERGLTTVQIGDATRPRSGKKAREWMNDDRVRTVLDRLREHYGDEFKTLITTAQVEPAVRQLLEDVGVNLPTPEFDTAAGHSMHYGEEKSRNDFANESVGYLYGCMDPGDDMILDALAELGLDATPVTVEDDDGEMKREKGRTFEGADAETAAALLASVRENHVAQAAGRYARNPDDADSQAVVYIHTGAAPTGFVDYGVPGVEWLATDLQRQIVDELASRPSATTREIADAVDCTKEHVRKTLAELEAEDLTSRRDGAGEHGADIWYGDDVTDALVDLGDTTNDPLKDLSRWSLAVSIRHSVDSDSSAGTGDVSGVATDGGVEVGGDPPPDDRC